MKQHLLTPLTRRSVVIRNVLDGMPSESLDGLMKSGAVIKYADVTAEFLVPASPPFDPSYTPVVYFDLRPEQSFHYRERYRIDFVGDYVVVVDQATAYRRAYDTIVAATCYAEKSSRQNHAAMPPWANGDARHVVHLTSPEVASIIHNGGRMSPDAIRRMCEAAPEVVGSILGVPYIVAYEREGRFDPRKRRPVGASAYIRDHYSLLRVLQALNTSESPKFFPLAINPPGFDGSAQSARWGDAIRIAPGATVVGGYMLNALRAAVLENGIQDPGSPDCATSIEIAGLMDEGLFTRILEQMGRAGAAVRQSVDWAAAPEAMERILAGSSGTATSGRVVFTSAGTLSALRASGIATDEQVDAARHAPIPSLHVATDDGRRVDITPQWIEDEPQQVEPPQQADVQADFNDSAF